MFNFEFRFIFYSGGCGGDVLARAITPQLPLKEYYDISTVNSLNRHACQDCFCGLFHLRTIPLELSKKLKLSSNVIHELSLKEKKDLIIFSFKLWLYKNKLKLDEHKSVFEFRLYLDSPITPEVLHVIDEVISSSIPLNLPSGPYLAKGHYISWEEELKKMFPNSETIYISSLPEQAVKFIKLFRYKTDDQYFLEAFGYNSDNDSLWDFYTLLINPHKEPYKEHIGLYKKDYENKNKSDIATYVFNADDLIVEERWKKIIVFFKIFNIYPSGIMQDFLIHNAEKNRLILKYFDVSIPNSIYEFQ